MIGILFVLSGGMILTDWQALGSDPCINYSPFHHPELREEYTKEAANSILQSPIHVATHPMSQPSSGEMAYNNIQANVCFPKLYIMDILTFNASAMKLKCMELDSCASCLDEDVTTTFPAPSVPCFSLGYRTDKILGGYVPLRELSSTYVCSTENSDYCACVTIPRNSTLSPLNDNQSIVLQKSLLDQSTVHIQALQVIEKSVYNVAVNKCESLHDTHGCHWIPYSKITGRLCSDCQPICWSAYHTLTFIQFCVGALLLHISLPTSRVSAVNILTDVVHLDIQVRS